MTTYQDPPLQSRRAARQNERGDISSQSFPDSQSTPQQPPAAPPLTPYTTPESLLYATQGRAVPDYDGPSFRGRRVAETPDDSAARSEAGYRVRDFSPDARRVAMQNWSQATTTDGSLTYQTQQRPPVPGPEAPAAPTDWSAPPIYVPEPVAPQPVYEQPVQQQPVYEQPVQQPVYEPQPVAQPTYERPDAAVAAEAAAPSFPDHTLSRRELRALREAQEGTDAGVGYPAEASATSTTPPMTAQPVERTHYADPEPPFAGAIPPLVEPAPWGSNPATTTGDQFSAFEALFGAQQVSAELGQEAPVQQVAALPQQAPVFEAPTYEEPAQPQYVAPEPQYDAPEPQYVAPEPQYVAPEPEHFVTAAIVAEVPATTSERPVGHWSRQAELDDEIQVSPSTISREVGIGVITTNALVLPEIPHHDFTRTITSTGDILVTGSINLPSSLSATGAMPAQLDESDIDHLLDPGDRQVASTDSQPVRAVKAVSTHTSSRGIINATPPKRGNRMLTTLIISAAAMLVVVVGLAVVIVASGVLS